MAKTSEFLILHARVSNIFRFLEKLASLLSRKQMNIRHLVVDEAPIAGEFLIVLSLQDETEKLVWLIKQIEKSPDLIDLHSSKEDL